MQLLNPDVADSRAIPATPKLPVVLVFWLFTKFSTVGEPVGDGDGDRPSMPNVLTAGSVPCLRRLIPGDVVAVAVFVLPAVVFSLISRQRVVSPAAEPESARIPARAALVAIGAATVLLSTFAVTELLEAETTTKIPGPSVPIYLVRLRCEPLRQIGAGPAIGLVGQVPLPFLGGQVPCYRAARLDQQVAGCNSPHPRRAVITRSREESAVRTKADAIRAQPEGHAVQLASAR